jgi:nitric oxide dioxygenase
MDPITIRYLRDSAALLPVGDPRPVERFYQRLFELAPEVRPMFKREIGLQTRKFSEMLAWVIAHLAQPDELVPELRKLGARHGGYGVEINHYAPVGSALIWMFQQTLGERFTPEMEEAWLEAYAFISSEMERGFREQAPETFA